MSTKKTTNYNLHSWLKSDEFHVSEINENFSALDSAVKAEADALAAALTAGIAGRPRLVYGTYRGNGDSSGTTVTLGFRPKVVFANAVRLPISNTAFHYLAVDGAENENLTITDTGFIAREDDGYEEGNVNYSVEYHYIVLY